MKKIWIFTKISILLIVLIRGGQCRRYDVESEAMKLYGEDLKSVLKRFRRTPDYLKILTDKFNDLTVQYGDVVLQTMYHYFTKMAAKITEMYQKEDQESPAPELMGSTSMPRLYRHHLRQSFFNPYIHQNLNKLLHPKREGGIEEEKINPVESLDQYHMLSSALTLQEKNMFRDMGFEFAGQIIHSIIKGMGNEDFSQKSTKFPMAGMHEHEDSHTTTTEHSHDVMTINVMPSTVVADTVTNDETFKYKYRAPRVARIKSA